MSFRFPSPSDDFQTQAQNDFQTQAQNEFDHFMEWTVIASIGKQIVCVLR